MSFSGSWQERYLEGQRDLISRLVMGIAAVLMELLYGV